MFVCSCSCTADGARNNSATEDPGNEQASQFRLFGDGELMAWPVYGQKYRSVVWAVILL